MNKYKFRAIDEGEFLEVANNSEIHDFQQTLEMKDFFEKSGRDIFLLGLVNEDDEPVMAALLYGSKIFAGYHLELTHGPLFKKYDDEQYKEFLEGLKDFSKKHGVLELILRPNVIYQKVDDNGNPITDENINFINLLKSEGFEKTENNYMGYDWVYVKDLQNLDEKSIFKSFTKDGQYSIKKTRQFGIKIRPLKYDELSKFKEVTKHTAERREYDDKTLEYYQEIFNSFGDKAEFLAAEINLQEYKENLILNQNSLKNKLADIEEFLVKTPNSRKKNNQKKEVESEISTYDKRISEADELINEHGKKDILLSVALFIYSQHETVYLFSGTYDKYKRFYAPFAMQDYVLNKTLKNGVPSYNFYGISGNFDGSDGVLGFKTNFSGYAVHKVGEFLYLPKPVKYKVISKIKKILGRN
ncbi:hypothetical protein BG261_02085 [Floricoccus tropicus]|uniref:Aminoacyltransferase FemA n=1 Tax=Floricoccus tropicus TaxID=1859473 RepID=A0A1E8GMB0_9LACT|nr:peptidoglycan bridge formation glycyltransferase FemA/FemB family protein [Floricoccus tropicus]OFI49394.1 hypothetical protein BG261_02085 [Floricoccus tropicus]